MFKQCALKGKQDSLPVVCLSEGSPSAPLLHTSTPVHPKHLYGFKLMLTLRLPRNTNPLDRQQFSVIVAWRYPIILC